MDDVTWWTAFGAISQAAGVVATLAAVVVSLWMAMRDRRIRAKGSAGFHITFAGDGSPGVYHVGFSLLNTGVPTLQVSSVGWRVGWFDVKLKALGFQWAIETWQGQEGVPTPYELPSNRSAITIKSAHWFTETTPDVRADLFQRRLPVLGWAPIKGVINITGRKPLIVPVSNDLADFLRGGNHPLTKAG